MAAAERVELRPVATRPLSLDAERELAAIVDRYFDGPDEHGVDLGAAVARWAFERGDVVCLPASPALRAEGMRLVPVTPWGDVRAAWVVAPGVTLRHASPTPRRPSLYELGAERIDDGRA